MPSCLNCRLPDIDSRRWTRIHANKDKRAIGAHLRSLAARAIYSQLLTVTALVCAALSLAISLSAQRRGPNGGPSAEQSFRETDRKLFAEIDTNNELMANVQYLCDTIGPRLTGSDKLKAANQWTLEKFKQYGLDGHLESLSIANGWRRGAASGRVVEPTAQTMTLASAGWTASTKGPVRGRLAYVKAEKPEDLEKFKGRLLGAIVLVTEPAKGPASPPPAYSLDSLSGEARENPDMPSPERRRLLRQVNEIFLKEGVVAELRDASKDFGLFNMTSMGGMEYRIDNLPTAFVMHEDYLRIWRLLESKQPVEVEVDIKNETIPGPVEIYNTIAEIRGGEKPDEVVIVGAHLDSWDLATGATDNATGSAVVMEAARAIHALGVAPKRTIRFALFAGEEQGSIGSRDYIRAHTSELDRIQGVVIHDTGTGSIKTFSLERRYDLREAMDRVAAPLQEIGLEELTMRRTSGSDHVPFRDAGVPSFFALQAPADYRRTHHSQADTFDKVHKDELIQGAKAVAALAWNLSEYPEKLPRKKMQPQAASGAGPADREGP